MTTKGAFIAAAVAGLFASAAPITVAAADFDGSLPGRQRLQG